MFKSKKFLFLAIITINLTVSANSQPEDLKFVNYDNKKIPGDIYINDIIRDSLGYIWFSGNGLRRFDGIQFKTYQENENVPNSLRADYTDNLVLDKNGTLWIGSSGGICYYNRPIDGFTFIDNSPAEKVTYAYAFVYDGNETLWFSTNLGLCNLNINNKKIKVTSLKNYSNPLYAIIDNSGNIWVSTRFDGLLIYNPANNTFKKAFICNGSGKTKVRCMIMDKQKNVWLSESNRLIKVNPNNLTDKNGNLSYEEIKEMNNITVLGFAYLTPFTADSILWIATYGSGLIAFNVNTKKICGRFLPDKNNPNAILSNTLIGLHTDNEYHLWIPSMKGISLLNMENQHFKSRVFPELNDQPDPYLIAMEQDKNEKDLVWIGTQHQGIIKYDWKQKKVLQWIKHFTSGDNNANTIADDGNGNLWIGSRNTLYQYNKQTGRFMRHPPLPTENKFKYPTVIYKILCLRGDTVLVAGSIGLMAYLTKKNQYRIIYSGSDFGTDYNSFFIMSAKQDNDGIIWCATEKGLVKADLKNLSNTVYLFNSTQNLIKLNLFRDLDFDGNKIILASPQGIVLFNKTSHQFSRLMPSINTPVNACFNIKVDTLHNYWINTNNGLVLFDQQKKIYKIFTDADGLMENVSVVPLDLINNTLVYKFRGGFTYIDPYSVEKNDHAPQPVITGLKVFEDNVLFDPVNFEKQDYKLTYKQNFISFDFNAFEFNYPAKIQFAYRLKGFNKSWIFCGGKRSATYTNLPPGHYTFEMKAANSEGLWSKLAVFKIYIRPAIWQTGLFKIAVIIIFIFTTYWLFKKRITQIRKEEERKTRTNKLIAEAEMKALRSQMNPHFLFNSLNSIQKYIWENKQEDAAEYLTKFARLVRSVLENSGAKMVILEDELASLRLYVELEHRRSNHKFDYRITVDEKLLTHQVLIPPLLLQPYIENAIWHGLNPMEKPGNLDISINKKENWLICIIDDDGIGRKASLEKKQSLHRSMGLNISSERIHLMEQETNIKATVAVTDKEDKDNLPAGTMIMVTLPLISQSLQLPNVEIF